MKIPVEGNPSLYRDIESGAILNCSDIEYINYQENKKRKLKELDEMNKLKSRINEIEELKSDINEVKAMMKLIISKLDSNS